MKKSVLISIGSVVAVILIILWITFRLNVTKAPVLEEIAAVKIDSTPHRVEYGIAVDSFMVIDAKVKRDQNLSLMLTNYGVSSQTIDLISKQTGTFDVKQIRSGNKYKLFLTKDSVPELAYFVYEHTLTDFVVIKFTDSLEIKLGEKPTFVQKKTSSGIIQTNLWDAMIQNNINPMMSIELSEIYAWSIDFFGLQKGDQFFVDYEERFLDSVSVGIESIHSALFVHQKMDFYAIQFAQNNQMSYFDEEGNSLRRAFLKSPLRFSHISSRFSKHRFHPVLKIFRAHSAVDYAAAEGTSVFSIGDGFVAQKGYQQNGAGNYVKIKHNSVYTTQYSHLKAFATGLKNGDRVTQGQLIGYVGKTGLATGPHLDFRFYKNGEPVDPLKVEAPSVEPISESNRAVYDSLKIETIKLLDQQRSSFNQETIEN
ncbi:MAG: peptidoglycan DD-metalloendopeptidase family protein [Salinivirgaceae bacterium]